MSITMPIWLGEWVTRTAGSSGIPAHRLRLVEATTADIESARVPRAWDVERNFLHLIAEDTCTGRRLLLRMDVPVDPSAPEISNSGTVELTCTGGLPVVGRAVEIFHGGRRIAQAARMALCYPSEPAVKGVLWGVKHVLLGVVGVLADAAFIQTSGLSLVAEHALRCLVVASDRADINQESTGPSITVLLEGSAPPAEEPLAALLSSGWMRRW